jgi:hypothetical protein
MTRAPRTAATAGVRIHDANPTEAPGLQLLRLEVTA